MAIRFRRAARRIPARYHVGVRRCEPPGLSSEWLAWVAENLLRGAEPGDISAELVLRGVSRPRAQRLVAECAESPLLGAARRLTRASRRFELVQRLLTQQANDAVNPTGIERRPAPSTAELFDHYYATSTPVVFTDLVTSWPAFGKWSPEYLAEHFGDAVLAMTDERESDPIYDARTEAHTKPITMCAFVERVRTAGKTNDFYMVAKNRNVASPALRPLFDDVRFPADWFHPDYLENSSALWFGPEGTVTPLHHDASSILFCQVVGRKRFRLASPLELALFDGCLAMYSACDPEGTPQDPRFSAVLFKDFVLSPGEALLIPAGWWHHVRALDVSISFAVNHFARDNNFDAWYRPGEI